MPEVIDGDRLAEAAALLERCVSDSLEVRQGAILGADDRRPALG
jgi:hypothetical protein